MIKTEALENCKIYTVNTDNIRIIRRETKKTTYIKYCEFNNETNKNDDHVITMKDNENESIYFQNFIFTNTSFYCFCKNAITVFNRKENTSDITKIIASSFKV